MVMPSDGAGLSHVERMLLLRALPAFAQLPDADLSIVVHQTKIRHFQHDETLLLEGERNHATYVIIEGRVKLLENGRVVDFSDRRIGLGSLNTLAGHRNRRTIAAEGPTMALELSRERLIEVLEEHFSILNALLRFLSTEVIDTFLTINRDYQVPQVARPTPTYLPSVERDLDLVERILAIRRVPAFAQSSLDAVAQYAKFLEQVYIPEGEVLWDEGEPCHKYLHLVHGHVRCVRSGCEGVLTYGPPGMPGFVGALADIPRWNRVEAISPVVALTADREILPDVLEDNVEMAKQFLSAIARRLTGLLELRGRTHDPKSGFDSGPEG